MATTLSPRSRKSALPFLAEQVGRSAVLHAARILLCGMALLVAGAATRAQFQQPLVFSSGGAVVVRNDTTGALTPVSGSPFLNTGQTLTLDVQGRYLFGIGVNSVYMYEITDSNSGAYAEVPNSPFSSVYTNSPTFIAVEPTGNYIAVVSAASTIPGEAGAETFQISPNAPGGPALVPVSSSFIQLDSLVIGASQPANSAQSFSLYLGSAFPASESFPEGEEWDTVSINASTGLLLGISLQNMDNTTARCYASDPQGRYIVLGRGKYQGQISLMGIDGKFQDTNAVLPDGEYPSQIWVDSTGTFLYVTYVDEPGSPVHIYQLNLPTYTLTETASSPLPGALLVPSYQPDPTGPFNYGAVGTDSDSIAAYTVDPTTGYFVAAANSPFAILGAGGGLTFSIVTGSQGASGPSIQLAPAAVSWGTLQIGTASAPQMITLTSNGAEALSVNAISVSGADASQFAETDTCQSPAVLQPGKFCSISIIFTPAFTGQQTAALNVTDNAAGSPQAVQLSGNGVTPPPPAPAATITPNPAAFATITQGTTSSAMSITVTNSGSATLHISSVTVGGNNPGDFVNPASNCSGDALASNAACTISVTFAPLAAGLRSETITLSDDAANSPQVIMVQGNANAAITVGSTSTTAATVTAGTTAQYQLQLSPGANFSGTLTLACSGAPVGAACQVPSSLQVSSGTSATLNVSITTSGGTSLVLPMSTRPWRSPRLGPLGLLSLAVTGLLVLLFGKRFAAGRVAGFARPARTSVIAAASLCVATLAILAGCGGGGGTAIQSVQIVTPQGTSTITVTPSAKSASGQALQLAPITLTLTVN
jgi:hypothetical protein